MILLCSTLCCNLLYKLPVMQHHQRLLGNDRLSPVPKFWEGTRKIRWPAAGIFMIYTVTLSIFPGFLAENLESELLRDWYPILLITVYNISDLVGQSLTAIYVVKSIGKATLACLARLLLYPLIVACLHGPKWLKTETPMVGLTFMLGITNAYLTSVFMILTPKSVPVLEEETAAIVMTVFEWGWLVGVFDPSLSSNFQPNKLHSKKIVVVSIV